ncbi:GNAT family N-acetyltransferase [Oceanobacillus longus]|uniref:GNAT family N-acetyltransferase n=1 Tax=Oceanobacillus longus TaxID=930120 RepID=A0ABV8GY73_9BACI
MIRQVILEDAEELASLVEQVETESPYMLYEAGEREVSAEKQSEMIKGLSKSHNSTIFIVEKDERLVGYLFVIGGNTKRNKHSAYIVAGIRNEYQGRGIGTALFEELERWASKQKVHRLELTVIKENRAAVKLYERSGFRIEGIKRNSLFIKGRFVDEYYMSKLLEG